VATKKNEKNEKNETNRASDAGNTQIKSSKRSVADALAPALDPNTPSVPPSEDSAPRATSSRVDTRRALGVEGERRAAAFLIRRGYRIEARNVRYDGVEIDLIARRGAVVAFVEVKTRRSVRFGAPELAVDRRKQARIIRAALAWRAQQPGFSRRIRFDVVSVLVKRANGRDRYDIDHLVAAFDASD
jgi:putative endonuclease